MTYDHWKATEQDSLLNEEPPPPTPEEERAEAWEYWHQRAHRFEEALREIDEIADEAADVDDGIPNRAMRILVIARTARGQS